MFNQPARPLEVKLLVTIISTIVFAVPKYIEEDLQRILKTILETQAPPTSEKSRNKPLKARSLDIYRKKSYIKC